MSLILSYPDENSKQVQYLVPNPPINSATILRCIVPNRYPIGGSHTRTENLRLGTCLNFFPIFVPYRFVCEGLKCSNRKDVSKLPY